MKPSLRTFVERVLASGLLHTELVAIAEHGATDADLARVPALPLELRDLLSWRNGFNLDEVRIHAIGGDFGWQLEIVNVQGHGRGIVFASDPSGFQYVIREDGAIVSLDHDGGGVKAIAADVDDFLRHYVFGERANEFGSEEWAKEVAVALGKG